MDVCQHVAGAIRQSLLQTEAHMAKGNNSQRNDKKKKKKAATTPKPASPKK